MNAPADLTINRLRCPLPARQPVVARLALETLAAEVAAAPAALPPQSLLVVRQLALTVPGLSLARQPDSSQRQAAAHGAGSLLADAWAQAARPALGEVSPQASAVCFGDAAELLACIARDGLSGRLDRWWWRTLLGAAFPDWRQAWVRRPEAAPAALRLLAVQGLAHIVRQALDGPAALVAAAADAPAPTAAPAAPPAQAHQSTRDTPPAASPESPVPAPAATPAGQRLPAARPATPAPTWSTTRTPPRPRLLPIDTDQTRPLAAPTAEDLAASGEARHLAAADAPPATAPPVTAALAATTAEVRDPQGMPPVLPSLATADVAAPAAGEPPARPAAAAAAADEPSGKGAPSLPPAATGTERAAGTAPVRNPSAARASRLSAEIGRLLAVGDSPPPMPSAPAPRPELALAPASPTNAADAPGWPLDATPIPIRSRHARLLFLVNLLLGDGLYPDFTQPATAGFPVPIWRLLALLGSGLAGPALRDDPLWSLLDRLADELPTGADCTFARDWPIPPARPQRAEATAAAPAIRPRTLRHARPQGFARWLAAYRQSVRQRLAAALDLPPALLGRAFLQEDSAALIWVSAAEIVVVQPLDEHPVAWRLAGLDRDPGFLPSAGRSLRFIFQ